MVVLNVTVNNCTPQTIVIGRRGTYDTMQIAFDLSFLIKNYGSGTAVLAIKRSQDESAYPAIVTQEDATLLWIVNETDTAYVGSGECQLMWYVDGGLAKTIIYPMVVMRDILQTAEQPPDGYEKWVDHLTELGAETQQNAQNAAQSASDAENAKDDAVAAKEAAEEAQEKAETAVTHYPKIENNYWMVWDVDSQSYVSTGIQAEGEDGYSPEISITTITGGHRVTITDKDHPQGQSFDVLDGQGGGGTSDYTDLTNKPQINGHTLTGNQTAEQLDLATPSDIPTDAGDIEYDESATYQAGSVGAELQEQNRQLSDVEENQIPELKNAIDQNKESIADTKSMIATVEATTTASKNYSVGDLLVYDGKLYKVTSAIATGATIIVGSNVTQTTVEDQLGSGGAVNDVQINGTSIVSSGVANIPIGNGTQAGVYTHSVNGRYGLTVTGSEIRISPADAGLIKKPQAFLSGDTRPIPPTLQHNSVFYGLAKAAGDSTQYDSANPVGTYTDGAKAAIQAMLGVAGIVGTVEGATASKAYAIGDAFLHSGALYKATASIASGDAITPGTNCIQTTLISIIKGE